MTEGGFRVFRDKLGLPRASWQNLSLERLICYVKKFKIERFVVEMNAKEVIIDKHC